ncbi:MAG TPA: ATP-binding protein [Lacunisphaera sp.]
MEFTHHTGEASLIIGDPRIGKSETARVFCDAQVGTARYIEVPTSNDMRSLYKAVAEALGVADGNGYKAVQIKERIEEVAQRAKIMLVFDEAQNLWTKNMRPKSSPDRILWINSLINLGVPVAFIALPEFITWMRICAEKTGWESKQLEQRITIHRRLPQSLTKDDFETLTRHIAPTLSPAVVKYIVGCALEQDGAAFVKKVISAASYRAKKAGRAVPGFKDIETAIKSDIMPSALTLRDALSIRHAEVRRRHPEPQAESSSGVLLPIRAVKTAPAVFAHGRCATPASSAQAVSST